MKKFTKALAIMMVLALSAFVFAACGKSKTESKTEGGKTESSQAGGESAQQSNEASAQDSAADVNYDNPTITIAEGDYAAMETFAKELQSGGHQGEVVKITGISTRSNFGVKASIMESDGSGKKIGTTYVIEGVEKIDDYPAEDATVELTGVVKLSDNNISCQISVPSDKITVK